MFWLIFIPSAKIEPLSGLSKPVSRLINVLFPDPDFPIIPILDPGFIEKLIPSNLKLFLPS